MKKLKITSQQKLFLNKFYKETKKASIKAKAYQNLT